jgi:hypothetical protein
VLNLRGLPEVFRIELVEPYTKQFVTSNVPGIPAQFNVLSSQVVKVLHTSPRVHNCVNTYLLVSGCGATYANANANFHIVTF